MVETMIDTTKEKCGVDDSKVMAYTTRSTTLQVMLGDQMKQYTRIRDDFICKLVGALSQLTTKVLLEHPSPNPRFHDMFIYLNATK
jgi:hypothetical protein